MNLSKQFFALNFLLRHELFSLNPFMANVPILYPLKHQKAFGFLGVFWRYEMGALARNGFKKSVLPVNWG